MLSEVFVPSGRGEHIVTEFIFVDYKWLGNDLPAGVPRYLSLMFLMMSSTLSLRCWSFLSAVSIELRE